MNKNLNDYGDEYRELLRIWAKTEGEIADICRKIDDNKKATISELSHVCELKRQAALEWYKYQIAYHEYFKNARELEKENEGTKNV